MTPLHWADRYPALWDDDRFHRWPPHAQRLYVFALEWARVHQTSDRIFRPAVDLACRELSDHPTDDELLRYTVDTSVEKA